MTNWFLKEYCTIKYALFTQKKVHKPRKFCAHVVEMLKKIEQFFFVLEIISRLGSKIFTSNYLKKLLTSKIQNPKIPGSRLKNPDYKIQTPKSGPKNPDYKIQTSELTSESTSEKSNFLHLPTPSFYLCTCKHSNTNFLSNQHKNVTTHK